MSALEAGVGNLQHQSGWSGALRKKVNVHGLARIHVVQQAHDIMTDVDGFHDLSMHMICSKACVLPIQLHHLPART